MINAGELNCRVMIQQESFAAPNAEGEKFRSWTTYLTVWAEIKPLSGGEIYRFSSLAATISHRVKVRYQPGITPKMRVKYGTRIFAINAVIDPEERKRELLLICTEVISEG